MAVTAVRVIDLAWRSATLFPHQSSGVGFACQCFKFALALATHASVPSGLLVLYCHLYGNLTGTIPLQCCLPAVSLGATGSASASATGTGSLTRTRSLRGPPVRRSCLRRLSGWPRSLTGTPPHWHAHCQAASLSYAATGKTGVFNASSSSMLLSLSSVEGSRREPRRHASMGTPKRLPVL